MTDCGDDRSASMCKECKWKCHSLSRVPLFATPWTVARQAPLSMEFSRQECWSGLTLPSPGNLPDPGIKCRPALQVNSLPSEPPGKPWKPLIRLSYWTPLGIRRKKWCFDKCLSRRIILLQWVDDLKKQKLKKTIKQKQLEIGKLELIKIWNCFII